MEKEVKDTQAPKKEEQAPDKPVSKEMVSETKHNNNKVLVIVLIVIGVMVVLGIASTFLIGSLLKKGGEKIIEEATGTNITVDEKGVSKVETKDGNYSASNEQKLPSDFPTSIPLYPNQKITGSFKQKTSSGNSWQVTTETSDEISKVVSNVKDAYSKSPWVSEAEVESDGSYTLSYAKTEYKVTVYITDNSSMNMTSLTYTVVQETTTE